MPDNQPEGHPSLSSTDEFHLELERLEDEHSQNLLKIKLGAGLLAVPMVWLSLYAIIGLFGSAHKPDDWLIQIINGIISALVSIMGVAVISGFVKRKPKS